MAGGFNNQANWNQQVQAIQNNWQQAHAPQGGGMAGMYGDINQLYDQMNPTYGIDTGLNNMLLGGYAGFGNQIQNAMSQIYGTNALNAKSNANYNQAIAPAVTEQVRQQGQNARINSLSPLLSQLFGSLGHLGSGSGGGGYTANNADGTLAANANPFAGAVPGGSPAQNSNRWTGGKVA